MTSLADDIRPVSNDLFVRSTASLVADINASADDAWELLNDWAGILRWWPDEPPIAIERVDLDGVHGLVPRARNIFTADGRMSVEALLKSDPVARRIYYDLTDGGIPMIRNYLASTTIDPIDDRSCRMHFSSRFDVVSPDQVELAEGIVTSVYRAIRNGFNAYFARAGGSDISPMADLELAHAGGPPFFSQNLNAFIVTRFEDCMQVLGDPATFSSSPFDSPDLMANFATAYLPIYERAGVPPLIPTLVTTDGTVHHRYRAAVDHSFNASSVRALESKIIGLVDQLIDGFVDAGEVDLYSEFCMKLPLFVICDMVGLPREEAPRLQRSADAMARLAGGAAESEESRIRLHEEQASFHQYLLPRIARLRETPDETLLSRLIHTPTEDGTSLNDAELIAIVTTLNVGGNETTTNGLGSMFHLCFSDAAAQNTLRDDPGKIERFIEEALRLETPVAAMPRFVYTDTNIGGVDIPAKSALLVSFNGANRDAGRFACPAHMDLGRTGSRNHLAFGMGPHFCLGATLSRVELRIAMRRILERMDSICLNGPVSVHRKVTVRGVGSLPITFNARLPVPATA